MKRILVSGYYGFDNMGDEAILAAIQELFSPYGVKLTVLSSVVPHVLTGAQIPALPRTHLPKIISAMKQSDLFISGGGGLFQDVTGFGSIPYYGGLLYMAQKLGLPTLIFAQGVGPLRYGLNRLLLRKLIQGVSAITVREPASLKLLQDIGIPSKSLHLTADPVLALTPAPRIRVEEILRQEGVDLLKPIIAVAIRPWKSWYEKQLKSFTAVLAQFARQVQGQLLLIPFQSNHDTWLAYEAGYSLACRPASCTPPIIVLRNRYTPQEMLGVIGRVQLMVGMRLHALIMAAAQGVPAVGVVYDPKVQLFSESVGYPFIPSVSSLSNADQFAQLMQETWNNQEQIKGHLQEVLPLFRERIQEAVDIGVRLMGM